MTEPPTSAEAPTTTATQQQKMSNAESFRIVGLWLIITAGSYALSQWRGWFPQEPLHEGVWWLTALVINFFAAIGIDVALTPDDPDMTPPWRVGLPAHSTFAGPLVVIPGVTWLVDRIGLDNLLKLLIH